MKPTRTGAGGPDADVQRRRNVALQLLGDRWSMWLLVRLRQEEGARFSDLAGEPGLSRRVLAERLQRLVDAGLVRTERYSLRPPRHDYRLTRRGAQLHRLCVALVHVGGGGQLDELAFVRGLAMPPGAGESLPARAHEGGMAIAEPAAAGPGAVVAARTGAGAGAAGAPGVGAHGGPAALGGATAHDGAQPHPSDRLLESDPDAAWAIYGETVAPLVRYDDQYRTSLVDTLDVYLGCDASVSVTAARLYAHRHTVRYRLGRVRELTGLDVDSLTDRERLVLGLRALRMFQRQGRELV